MTTRCTRIAAGGARVMIGGVMGVGSPHRLIDELVRQQHRNLTLICNDAARPGIGVGRLIDARSRAVIRPMQGKLVLIETAEGVSVEDVIAATDARLEVDPALLPGTRRRATSTRA